MAKHDEKRYHATTIKLTDDILDKLQALQRRLMEQSPGINITMSDVIRSSIMRGVECYDD